MLPNTLQRPTSRGERLLADPRIREAMDSGQPPPVLDPPADGDDEEEVLGADATPAPVPEPPRVNVVALAVALVAVVALGVAAGWIAWVLQ